MAQQESSCLSKKGKKSFPFCNTLPNRPLRCHAFHNHVLAISDPMKICWTCGEICFQASQIKRHLSGPCQGGHYLDKVKKWAPLVSEMFCCILVELKLTTWEILLQYVAKHPEILPEETSLTPDDIRMMNAFHQYCRVPHRETYSFSLPNTLTGALHWRIQGNLPQRISPWARECLARLHEKSFRGGSARTPTATVSVPPQLQPVVPMAPPATSKSQEPRQQVVPLAPPAPPPRPQQWPASQNLAVQPVAPLAPPIPCYGMANPLRMLPASSRYRVSNRPAVPLALPSTRPPVAQQPRLPRPQPSTLERGMVSSQVVPMAPPTSVADPAPEPSSLPLAGMDVHFHLDRLYSRMKRFNHYDVEASLWRKPKGVACHIVYCIPCYCFPEIWPEVNYLNNQLPSSADQFAVSWHPTRVYDYFDPAKGGRF